jgi:tetratricopeptide (TPR) repeat protein
MKLPSLLPILFIALLLSCTPKQVVVTDEIITEPTLGVLQHDFNLNEATVASFEEGLLLLHNFEYDDALMAFEAATAADSTEVMTHWGEAMCHYKALWRLQNTEKGKAIMERLGATTEERLSSIEDPIEKSFWEGLEIMYGEGEFDDRNKALSKHMASLHQQYPDHQEIAVFYALSLIWSTEEYGNGSDDLRLAAAIADKVIEANPMHPGALHYKIHALDGPNSAADAKDAADAYAKVAADASHALHMPSHIYLAMGEWDGVVNSNRVSYDASVNRMKDNELKDGARGYHSYAWLHYGLLQQGRYAEAEALLADMLDYVPKDPTKGARGYLVGMQSRQFAEQGRISDKIDLDTDVKVGDIGITAKSMRSFLRAQLAYEAGDMSVLDQEVDWLMGQREIAAQQVSGDGIALCAAGTSRYAPTENAVMSTDVVINQIQALKALLDNNTDRFEAHMQRAIEMEYNTDFPAGPPRITQPSFEQYGEWLIAQGRHNEAIEQFDRCLERMPKRSRSLKGKMTALEALDMQEDAQAIHHELQAILSKADDPVS